MYIGELRMKKRRYTCSLTNIESDSLSDFMIKYQQVILHLRKQIEKRDARIEDQDKTMSRMRVENLQMKNGYYAQDFKGRVKL
jgi:hypothetical protein